MWDRIWYRRVDAVRPGLLTRALLLVLALDAWMLLIPRGALYGSGGFNVAHFAWLDWLQPLPTPGLYVGLVICLGMLCFISALGQPRRWILVLICLIYTYAWAMSLLDRYQHHYFLSLVLLCVACFPPCRDPAGSRDAPAWAYRLLGATVAIMYFYTAVGKLDADWRSGATLYGWMTHSAHLADWLPGDAADPGVWQRLSIVVVVCEFILAAGYLAVVCTGEPRRWWDHAWRLVMLAIAIGLHVSIELAGFHIGWFSYYMLVLAAVFLLPAAWLQAVGRLVQSGLRPFEEKSRGIAANVGVVLAALAALGTVAATLSLPGVGWACLALAVGLLLGVMFLWRGQRPQVAAEAMLVIVACVALGGSVWFGGAPFQYWLKSGQDQLARGNAEEAIKSLTTALRYPMGLAPERSLADLHHALGTAWRKQGDRESAAFHLQTAVRLQPRLAESHFHLGNLWREQDRLQLAKVSYEAAVECKPEFVEAICNLGSLLAQQGQWDEAVGLYRRALAVDPRCVDAHLNLAKIWQFRQDAKQAENQLRAAVAANPALPGPRLELAKLLIQLQKSPEAREQLDELLMLDADVAMVHFLRGVSYDLEGQLETARRAYLQAITVRPMFAEALFNLGTIHARQGESSQAIERFEQALAANPKFQLARDAIENLRNGD